MTRFYLNHTVPHPSRTRIMMLAMVGAVTFSPIYAAIAETGAPTVTGTPKVATGAHINPASTSVGADANTHGVVSTTIPSSARQPATSHGIGNTATDASKPLAETDDDIGGTVRADTHLTTPTHSANRSDMATPMRSDLRGTTRPVNDINSNVER